MAVLSSTQTAPLTTQQGTELLPLDLISSQLSRVAVGIRIRGELGPALSLMKLENPCLRERQFLPRFLFLALNTE